MTYYPNNIDDNTSLPPSYSQDNTYSYKFSADIDPSSTKKLTLPVSGGGLTLLADTSYLIRINCMIFDASSPTTTAQYIKNVNAYCDGSSAVSYVETSTDLTYNPSGQYNITFSTPTGELSVNVVNTSTNPAKAIAIIDYVSS